MNLCSYYFSEDRGTVGISMTPLEIAIAENNLEIAALLRSAGGQVGIVSESGVTSLSNAFNSKGTTRYHYLAA